jgi:hypothetical protein
MITALAIDPGPDRSGVVSVSFDGHNFDLLHWRHQLFRGGVFAAGAHEPLIGGAELDFLLDDVASTDGILVIEQIIGFAYQLSRVPALIETARVEGRIIEKAIARGVEPRMVTAKAARGELCRTKSAGDTRVEAVVRGLLRGFPTKITQKEVAHICDGGALAIVEICRALRISIPRTPELEMALIRAGAEEDRARSTKRARVAAGELVEEKRRPTRGQRARRGAGTKAGWDGRRST